jgi:hypothetical protein
VLAERTGSTVDQAFTVLRRHARVNGLKLNDVARAVVAGELMVPVDADERGS